jgi:hypothetical protein
VLLWLSFGSEIRSVIPNREVGWRVKVGIEFRVISLFVDNEPAEISREQGMAAKVKQ